MLVSCRWNCCTGHWAVFWAQALSKPCEPHSLDQDDHRRLFKTRTSNCFVMGCCYNHQLTPNCVFPLNFWIISQCPFEMRSISQHSLFTIWKWEFDHSDGESYKWKDCKWRIYWHVIRICIFLTLAPLNHLTGGIFCGSCLFCEWARFETWCVPAKSLLRCTQLGLLR